MQAAILFLARASPKPKRLIIHNPISNNVCKSMPHHTIQRAYTCPSKLRKSKTPPNPCAYLHRSLPLAEATFSDSHPHSTRKRLARPDAQYPASIKVYAPKGSKQKKDSKFLAPLISLQGRALRVLTK